MKIINKIFYEKGDTLMSKNDFEDEDLLSDDIEGQIDKILEERDNISDEDDDYVEEDKSLNSEVFESDDGYLDTSGLPDFLNETSAISKDELIRVLQRGLDDQYHKKMRNFNVMIANVDKYDAEVIESRYMLAEYVCENSDKLNFEFSPVDMMENVANQTQRRIALSMGNGTFRKDLFTAHTISENVERGAMQTSDNRSKWSKILDLR